MWEWAAQAEAALDSHRKGFSMRKRGVQQVTPERILSDLIRLKTVNPPGNEIEVVKYLKVLFDAAGIPYDIVEPERIAPVLLPGLVPALKDFSSFPIPMWCLPARGGILIPSAERSATGSFTDAAPWIARA